MGDLNGKVAVITGAGRGLGREEAMQLAQQGARVVINDIGLPDAKEAAEQTVEEIKGLGGEAIGNLHILRRCSFRAKKNSKTLLGSIPDSVLLSHKGNTITN